MKHGQSNIVVGITDERNVHKIKIVQKTKLCENSRNYLAWVARSPHDTICISCKEGLSRRGGNVQLSRSSRWDVWMLGRGRTQPGASKRCPYLEERGVPSSGTKPPCAVQPMCNDGSSSWKCQNKNRSSCRWTYKPCWDSGIQLSSSQLFQSPTFIAFQLRKGF